MNAPAHPSLPQGLHVPCDDSVRPGLLLGGMAGRLLAGRARAVLAPVLGLGESGGAVFSDAPLAEGIAGQVRRLFAAVFDRALWGTSLAGGDV